MSLRFAFDFSAPATASFQTCTSILVLNQQLVQPILVPYLTPMSHRRQYHIESLQRNLKHLRDELLLGFCRVVGMQGCREEWVHCMDMDGLKGHYTLLHTGRQSKYLL